MIQCKSKIRAQRNRSKKDQKSFFFFWFCFRFPRFQSSENKVDGIRSGRGIMSQSKNSLPVPFKLRARKKRGSRGKTSRDCETVPCCIWQIITNPPRTSKTTAKKRLALEDFTKQVALQTGLHCSIAYNFILFNVFVSQDHAVVSGCSFPGFFCLGINWNY